MDIAVQFASGITRDPGRLTVSRGVVAASAALTGQNYASGAWIPRGPFEALRAHEFEALTGARRPERSRSVGLVRVRPGLLARLRSAIAGNAPAEELSACVEALCEDLAGEWVVRAPPTTLSAGCNLAGLHTVTKDPDTQVFVGLHVDTFDQEYEAGRRNAKNRVSANVGDEPRYFLFVPVAFQRLAEGADRRRDGASVVCDYLQRHPEQPVLRLRVEPGEAYVAPTESLIHDASSLWMKTRDLHVTGRGTFDPMAP